MVSDKRVMRTFYCGSGWWLTTMNTEQYNHSDPEKCRYWLSSKKPTNRTVRKWKKAARPHFT